MKKHLFLYSFLVFLISCEDQLNVTLPYEGNKFVLYAQITPNQVIGVKIDRTYPPTGDFLLDDSFLATTKVKLFENGVEIEELKRVNTSNYFSSSLNFKPKVGNTYSFKVSAANFTEAVSEPQQVPPPMKLISAKFSDQKVLSLLNPKIPSKLLVLEFEKANSTNSYFLVEIVGQYNGVDVSNSIMLTTRQAEFDDPCVYGMFFNNKCFNKATNTLPFIVEMETEVGRELSSSFGPEKITSLRIKLSAVDNFYYEFYTNYSTPDGIFKAFEATKPTKTNIKNGYGAILAKNDTTITLTKF